MPRRADSRDGPRAQGAARTPALRPRRGRAGRDSRSRVRRGVCRAGRAASPWRRGGRRSHARGPLGRQLLRDRNGADPLGLGWCADGLRGRRSARRAPRSRPRGERVSWQIGAFAILALALAGGFAWYERVRPAARIVALVGTLAAFAALGRIAFAAFPNVKPTTDIVLVSGYALGGGPGFAVGALAALASNFFFGQGPWTPWQMAGWGMTGVIGAVLARMVGRQRPIGRWPLALVCTVVGFAFTTLQDVGDWVTYSDHSLASLGIYVGKGFGFDCIHAAGCLVFALALGPALIRSLSRFAMRLQVTWQPVVGVLIVVTASVLASLPGVLGVGSGVARAADVGSPAGYLVAAQNPDGGFGPAPGQASSALYAGWGALGVGGVGENPQVLERGGHSVIDYIASGLAANSDPGSVERTILVVRSAGLTPEDFGGRNLLSALERDIGRNGSVSNQSQ